jgi:hypothetical protein
MKMGKALMPMTSRNKLSRITRLFSLSARLPFCLPAALPVENACFDSVAIFANPYSVIKGHNHVLRSFQFTAMNDKFLASNVIRYTVISHKESQPVGWLLDAAQVKIPRGV